MRLFAAEHAAPGRPLPTLGDPAMMTPCRVRMSCGLRAPIRAKMLRRLIVIVSRSSGGPEELDLLELTLQIGKEC